MKKSILLLLTFILISSLVLSGCGEKGDDESVLSIGASPVPHAQILELIKDDLKAEGIELKIIEFTDYVTPNMALADGEIDANFFQHKPYLDNFAKENNLDLVSLVAVHIEPLGFYSDKIDDIEDLKDGSTIAIPNDPTNEGRALILLQNNGLIKLKDDAGLEATEKDIAENPKNLKFETLEAAQLPRVLKDFDGAVINGNFALDAGLTPTEDALILEDGNSPYVNIIAVRKDNENDPKFEALIKAIQSEKVKKFIEENYDGGVVPAF